MPDGTVVTSNVAPRSNVRFTRVMQPPMNRASDAFADCHQPLPHQTPRVPVRLGAEEICDALQREPESPIRS